MAQKTLTEVIDIFSAAVARLAKHAPPDVIAQLHEATGDLIERLATAAQDQASHAALSVFNKGAAITDEVQQVRDDRREDAASMEHNLGMVLDQAEIEQAELGRHAARLELIEQRIRELTARVADLEGDH